jgi:hypothetical protein
MHTHTHKSFELTDFYIQCYECFVSSLISRLSVTNDVKLYLLSTYAQRVESRKACMHLGFVPAKYKLCLTNTEYSFTVYNARGCIASRLFTL